MTNRFLVPRQFGAIADVCASEKSRHALSGVNLARNEAGHLIAEASDGKAAIRAEYTEPSLSDFPEIPRFPEGNVPGGIVPAAYWSNSLKAVARPRKGGKSIIEHGLMAVTRKGKKGIGLVTIGSTDLSSVNITSHQAEEGTFPSIVAAIPTDTTGTSRTAYLDLDRLIPLLRVLDETVHSANKGHHMIRLTVHGDKAPIHIEALNQDKTIRADAILMPIDVKEMEAALAPPVPVAEAAATPVEPAEAVA